MRIFGHRIEIPEFSLDERLCFVFHFAYEYNNCLVSQRTGERIALLEFMRPTYLSNKIEPKFDGTQVNTNRSIMFGDRTKSNIHFVVCHIACERAPGWRSNHSPAKIQRTHSLFAGNVLHYRINRTKSNEIELRA